MATEELEIVAQGQKLFRDGPDQRGVIAVGKVGAADRALEQHISHQRELGSPIDEYDVPRGVARAMQHVEPVRSQRHMVTFAEPSIGRHIAHRKTEGAALLLQCLQKKRVSPVGTCNGHIVQRPAQLICAAGVVQMTVRQPDALDRDARLLDRFQNSIDIAARIHDHRALAGFIPKQGAVLLEGRHRDHDAVQLTHWLDLPMLP